MRTADEAGDPGAAGRRRQQPRGRRRGVRRARGRRPQHRALRVEGDLCGGRLRRGRRGGALGRRRGHRRRARLGRHRGALRHPRHRPAPPRSRTSAPTARRSAQTVARVRTWDRAATGRAHLRRRRLRLRLPHQPLQAGPRPLRRARGDLPARPRRPRRPRAVRRAGRAPSASRSASGPPPPAVREAVLGLRRGKAMVLDAEDHDTWSTGSFFTNPVVRARPRARGCARRGRSPTALVKTSAAWLIEHAGFAKGYGHDRVRLSSRHTLALTNRGGASTAELLALAREIRDGVQGSVRHRAGQRAGAGRLRALRPRLRRCRSSCR